MVFIGQIFLIGALRLVDDFAGFTKVVDVSFGGADVDADACSGLLVGWTVEGGR